MPHLQHGRHTLHWQRRGGGAPLLLIQGMAGHHALWGEPLLTALAADFDVVTFDHRGIGESTDPDERDFTVGDLARDAVAVLDVLGWDTAHVMGISMGGMVAQELVLSAPERVRSLVLGCTYCGGSGASLSAVGPLRMLQAMELATRTGDVDAALRVAFEVNVSAPFAAEAGRYAAFREASLAVAVPVPVVLRQAKAAFAHDASARLPQVTAPTLVVHGTADQMLGYDNAAVVAGAIPGAELHTLDGVGHLFWWEQPEVTAQLLRAHCLR